MTSENQNPATKPQNIDLPIDLIELMKQIAKANNLTIKGIASLAIRAGIPLVVSKLQELQSPNPTQPIP